MIRSTKQWGADAAWLAVGSAITLLLAVLAITDFSGLGQLFRAPIMNSGDALSHAAIIKQAIEGNPLSGSRLGFPFGSNWYDWPSLDWGMLGMFKLLALFTHDYVVIFNLFFLIGFPAAFASAYVVIRRFELRPSLAFVGGVSFALASYHFERLTLQGHLFLTMYWVVPPFFLLGWRLVQGDQPRTRAATLRRALGLVFLSGFGVYYTAFGLIGISAALLLAMAAGQPRVAVRNYIATVVPLMVGVALQYMPTAIHHWQFGANPLAFRRSPLESDVFAMRPVQLLIPHVTHQLEPLRQWAQNFYEVAIPGNESVTSSVGVIAAVGLFVLIQLGITAIAGRALDDRFRYLITMTVAAISFAAIGGVGLLLSLLGFTEIRSWNRLSIFIQFAGLLALLLALTPTIERYSLRIRRLALPFALALALGIVWVDQTPAPTTVTLNAAVAERAVTADFVHHLEERIPTGAAVYQLPFVGYPEAWFKPHYGSYEFLKPFLESTDLRFNLGGMKGRDGDQFFRALGQRSIETQIAVARALGFSGIYVDRTGLIDGGTQLVSRLEQLLGEDAADWRSDHRVVYFDLKNDRPARTLTVAEAAAISDFTPGFPKRHLSD